MLFHQPHTSASSDALLFVTNHFLRVPYKKNTDILKSGVTENANFLESLPSTGIQIWSWKPETLNNSAGFQKIKKNILGRTIYSKHLQLTKKAKKIPGNLNNALPSGEKS